MIILIVIVIRKRPGARSAKYPFPGAFSLILISIGSA